MPNTLTRDHVEQASDRLRTVIHNTPLEYSNTFSRMSGANVYLKCENLQKTGSFKIRGAYNTIAQLKEAGELSAIVASSAGNHAQGVAYAASRLGIPATIVMPTTSPLAKVQATQDYGARVVLHGSDYDSCYAHAMTLQQAQNATFVHPFDDLAVIAGQATIGVDLLKALPTTDVVFVPAGGGGLLAGVAFLLKQVNPRIQVIGVQAQGADAIVQSFQQGTLMATDQVNTIADGIAVKKPGTLTYELIAKHVDDMITVSDTEIASAILNLLERSKLMVEPAGATSLAGLLSGQIDVRDKHCVAVLSGGNIDVNFVGKIIDSGLHARHRKLKLRAIIRDVPGSLEQFTRIIGENNANIVKVRHDRMNLELDIRDVMLHVTCEVSGEQHGKQLLSNLKGAGYPVFEG